MLFKSVTLEGKSADVRITATETGCVVDANGGRRNFLRSWDRDRMMLRAEWVAGQIYGWSKSSFGPRRGTLLPNCSGSEIYEVVMLLERIARCD